jgi:hypothetical protein
MLSIRQHTYSNYELMRRNEAYLVPTRRQRSAPYRYVDAC